MNIADYLPILVLMVVALLLGVVMLLAAKLFSTSQPGVVKNAAYECGFEAFEDARLPFDVRFYLVSILFILFDLETAFFFPWAVVLRQIGYFGFAAMMIFLGLLVLGFVYEWKRGALEWE